MRLIIIVVALVVALLIAFAVSGIFNQEQPQPEPQVLQTAPVQPEQKIEKVNIYVAQRDIPIGSVLSAADYDIKPWPSHLLPPGALLYGDAKIRLDGMITATPIVKNEPLLLAKLRNPNDPSFIAGQLKEGMRAVTISVNMIDSVAGFVQPGDKVDVMFTFDLVQNAIEGSDVTSTQQGSRGGDKQGNVSFSEVIMPNVKVLAVDQRVVAGGAQKDGQPAVPSSVTLEVNQRAAQKLKLADKMGKLSLVLRSIKDKDNFDRVRPTAEQDLTRILPPAYFPALFDSDAAYDFSVVDLYGNTLSDIAGKEKLKADGKEKENADPFVDVNIYRGTQLEKVEVKRP
jgi:pilus assembly protein CpaB